MGIEEDREILATQRDEYEESLRQDELRRVAELEAREKEQKDAQEALEREQREKEQEAQRAEQAAADAAAALQNIQNRRREFEASHTLPEDGESQTMLKFRAPTGAIVQRKFRATTQVSALFEFAAVADWGDCTIPGAIDLRMSFPARSLKDSQSQTLQEAELCPSAMLLVVFEED